MRSNFNLIYKPDQFIYSAGNQFIYSAVNLVAVLCQYKVLL